ACDSTADSRNQPSPTDVFQPIMTIQATSYEAQRVKPMLMRRRTSEPNCAADFFPSRTVGSHPRDLRINRIKPRVPLQHSLHSADGTHSLHSADGTRRWRWQPDGLGRLANRVGELDFHPRPCS